MVVRCSARPTPQRPLNLPHPSLATTLAPAPQLSLLPEPLSSAIPVMRRLPARRCSEAEPQLASQQVVSHSDNKQLLVHRQPPPHRPLHQEVAELSLSAVQHQARRLQDQLLPRASRCLVDLVNPQHRPLHHPFKLPPPPHSPQGLASLVPNPLRTVTEVPVVAQQPLQLEVDCLVRSLLNLPPEPDCSAAPRRQPAAQHPQLHLQLVEEGCSHSATSRPPRRLPQHFNRQHRSSETAVPPVLHLNPQPQAPLQPQLHQPPEADCSAVEVCSALSQPRRRRTMPARLRRVTVVAEECTYANLFVRPQQLHRNRLNPAAFLSAPLDHRLPPRPTNRPLLLPLLPNQPRPVASPSAT